MRLNKRGELVKVHPRQTRGACSTDPNDYPKELNAYTLRSSIYLCRKGAELGESVGFFSDKLLGGPIPWHKMRQAYKLLRLGDKYNPLRLSSQPTFMNSLSLGTVSPALRLSVTGLWKSGWDCLMTLFSVTVLWTGWQMPVIRLLSWAQVTGKNCRRTGEKRY